GMREAGTRISVRIKANLDLESPYFHLRFDRVLFLSNSFVRTELQSHRLAAPLLITQCNRGNWTFPSRGELSLFAPTEALSCPLPNAPKARKEPEAYEVLLERILSDPQLPSPPTLALQI